MSTNEKIEFPGSKHFAFTIIDDTDEAYLKNIKPVYDILYENKIIVTKTVWVYPSRNITESRGDCIESKEYLDFIKDIHSKGYEIGLHGVGSGDFKRDEIIQGLIEFHHKLGFFPKLHTNHSYNRNNIYWGYKRFDFPLNYLVKKLYKNYDDFSGEDPLSEYFWGDFHKKYIQFTRNYEIDNINTFKQIPFIPYREKMYDEYSNLWFGATFAPNPWIFNKIVTESNIDQLEKEGGICILFTHLGYYMQKGVIDPGFIQMMKYIGNKKNGWFVPVSNILEFLYQRKTEKRIAEYLPFFLKKKIELQSLITRLKYRYFIKIDDYHYGKTMLHE